MVRIRHFPGLGSVPFRQLRSHKQLSAAKRTIIIMIKVRIM